MIGIESFCRDPFDSPAFSEAYFCCIKLLVQSYFAWDIPDDWQAMHGKRLKELFLWKASLIFCYAWSGLNANFMYQFPSSLYLPLTGYIIHF